TVTCRHCHRASAANRRFCGGCGQSLWEICPQCKAESAADERYCGSCGTDILGELSDQSRQFQGKLDEAQELLKTHRFDAAISCLRGVAAVSDPRFDRWAQQALSAIADVERERDTQNQAALEIFSRARQHFMLHAYEATTAELEKIPQPLRSADATTLLHQATSARRELLELSAEIRSALEEKRTADLLPKIERLLVLKPNHQQARQIAEQLRDSRVKQAKRYLLAHKYRESLDELAQVPTFVRNPEFETIHDTASELLALLDAVRNAALADRPTLGLADRLVKLAPNNPEAAAARAAVAERAATRPPDRRLGAASLVPPPHRTFMGPPVDWLAFSTRLPGGDEKAAATLREHPGQFFVAIGLALQGLGLAAVPIDLAPAETSTLAQMFPTLARRTTSAAWGLDLSDFALKAVKLAKDPKDGLLKVAAAEYILHSMPLTSPEAEQARPEIFDQTLRDFLSRTGELKGTKVCANLSSQRVLGRFFELPPLPAKKVPDAIAYEAKHQLPVALDELCWASHTLDPVDSKSADGQPRQIMVCAARAAHVEDRLTALKSAGIAVDHLQSDCLALHNAIVHELWSGAGATSGSSSSVGATSGSSGNAGATAGSSSSAAGAGPSAVCLMDIGTQCTSIVVSSRTNVWFRTFGQGGANLTGALVKQLGVTYQQAEQIVRDPARARRYWQMSDVLRPLLIQLAGELERSLTNYEKVPSSRSVERIYGVGGGFQVHGLLRHLRFGR
ncbi:MAG: pilus assembly protein PilM, partial [Planctomycetaceae bacterium]|nr:pilus assembly protein PilM [Planctomycetaceae bacterium]